MKPVQTIACLILFATLCGSASSETLPNILLILADDVGSDAISCYGGQSYPTINIDRLAEEGMLFTHGYAMPVCHPSRISLMTGCYPYRFGPAGERWGDFPKAAEKLTIAHRMKRAGYATAVAGKWQLCLMKDDKLQPRRLGFDQWQLFGWHEGARFHDPFLYENGRLLTDTKGRYGPDMYVEFLINFMREQKAAGKPFFAYYSMALCHAVTDDLKNEYVTFASDNRWMTYGEMVASMDDMVGRLMSALDEMQIAENTLVIFTTDNGTSSRSYLYVDETGKMIKPPVVSVRNNEVVPGGKRKTRRHGHPRSVNCPLSKWNQSRLANRRDGRSDRLTAYFVRSRRNQGPGRSTGRNQFRPRPLWWKTRENKTVGPFRASRQTQRSVTELASLR